VGVDDNFFELGGDSILSIQVVARARQEGLHLTPQQLFQYQTVAELAAVAETTTDVEAEQGAVRGEVPLTPIQRWFFEQEPSEPWHFNQSMLLEVHAPLGPELLEQALGALVRHHDALRLRFWRAADGWRQEIADADAAPVLEVVDLTGLAGADREAALAEAAARLQTGLKLEAGQVVRAGLMRLGGGRPDRLLVVVHHLAVDGVSWRVLLEDLETACEQLVRGEVVVLPAKTTSFKAWAERLVAHVRSGALEREAAYWLDEARGHVRGVPVDDERGLNTETSERTVAVRLSAEETRALLVEVPAAYNTQIQDALLAALARGLSAWLGSGTVLVDLEGHGREEVIDGVDLSRTVGWFTSFYPVMLDLGGGLKPAEALKAIKEQLRGVPNRGIGYGMLRYLEADDGTRERLRALPQSDVLFNYLGQFDQMLDGSQLLARVKGIQGPTHSRTWVRRHLLEINSVVNDGRLQMQWTYSENLHGRETIERVARSVLDALRNLIAAGRASSDGSHTPSDFPEAEVSQRDLDKLMAKLRRSRGVSK
jgi:non-ribosomal peptide synthase protein (TIGR01720 family)